MATYAIYYKYETDVSINPKQNFTPREAFLDLNIKKMWVNIITFEVFVIINQIMCLVRVLKVFLMRHLMTRSILFHYVITEITFMENVLMIYFRLEFI
jgi:hypothetical protein